MLPLPRAKVSAEPLHREEFVFARIGSRFAVPRAFRGEIDDPDQEVKVAIEVEVAETGRPECQSLTLTRRKHGPPITGASMKSLPLAAYCAAVAYTVALEVKQGANPDRLQVQAMVALRDLDGAAQTAFSRAFAAHMRMGDQRRRVVVDDEHLQRVAQVYREALQRGEHPTAAVQVRWGGVPRSTASRWIRMARDPSRRFLEPTTERKAGG